MLSPQERSSVPGGRRPIFMLAASALAMIGAVCWYYADEHAAVETGLINQVAAVAAFKAEQIANWRHERIGDGRVLAATPLIGSARRLLSGGKSHSDDFSDVNAAIERLSREFHYTDVALVDLDGSVRFRLNEANRPNDELRQPVRRRLSQDAAAAVDVILSDLTLETRSGRPLMAVVVPVPAAGAFILEIDPAVFLYPYVQSWPASNPSAETALLRRDGAGYVLSLNELKHAPGSALTFRMPLPADTPDERRLDAGWFRRGLDYRGVPVLSVIHHVPESPWYVSSKVDTAEVKGSLLRLSVELVLIVGLIAGVALSGARLISSNRQVQVLRSREEWFRTVSNETPAYLWLHTPGTKAGFINRPFAGFLGTTQEFVDLAETFVHADDRERMRADYLECIAARRDYRAEFRVRRFDGAYRWVAAHGVPRVSSTGGLLGYAGVLSDITERKDAEAGLLSANDILAKELQERTRAEQEIHSLGARLITAQEQERARLARELHDDISQQVAAISIGFSNFKRKLLTQTEVIAQAERLQHKLVLLAQSTRRMSHELHPAALQHAGLEAALQNYCKEFAELTACYITFRSDGVCEALSPEAALCIYRVAQEALQNSLKHARTDIFEVTLANTGDAVCLTVADYGVGMRPGAAAGLGLVSMRERTRLVNGSMDIRSQPGEGVAISLRVPTTLCNELQ